LLQSTGDRARERYFKSIEDPGDTERNYDERMEAAPREAVKPSRNVGFDHCGNSRFRLRIDHAALA
jgi:hypothetical protein